MRTAPEPPLKIPEANTEQGALVRLLIVETGPQSGDATDAKEAMGWMKRILENRLRRPADFEAQGATTLTQIIEAHDNGSTQFRGFDTYPEIAGPQEGELDKALKGANAASASSQYRKLLKSAVDVATADTPPDPSVTGLYFWRTHGSRKPDHATLFRTLAGIDFYTLSAHRNVELTRGSHGAGGPFKIPHRRPGPR